ncbi:hypothetical protein E2C01_002607 [Portunus trituberculatus]|uniref:Uncharacterized protein n=1 Tax=Portunus trituberculatus TaxID=210409 RepID=A0A5B7CR72_PORTR|nr:hypothetical protein [Portunus trituberculatus]
MHCTCVAITPVVAVVSNSKAYKRYGVTDDEFQLMATQGQGTKLNRLAKAKHIYLIVHKQHCANSIL